jgi:hypothetical protein
MIDTAYTVIYGTDTPNWNVGPTYEWNIDAQREVKENTSDDVIPVVSWIDDFEQIDRGVLLFRSDGIHEVSWVVAEEPSNLVDTMNEGVVGTSIVAASEVQRE